MRTALDAGRPATQAAPTASERGRARSCRRLSIVRARVQTPMPPLRGAASSARPTG